MSDTDTLRKIAAVLGMAPEWKLNPEIMVGVIGTRVQAVEAAQAEGLKALHRAEKAEAALECLQKKVEQKNKALKLVASHLASEVELNFMSTGSFGGADSLLDEVEKALDKKP